MQMLTIDPQMTMEALWSTLQSTNNSQENTMRYLPPGLTTNCVCVRITKEPLTKGPSHRERASCRGVVDCGLAAQSRAFEPNVKRKWNPLQDFAAKKKNVARRESRRNDPPASSLSLSLWNSGLRSPGVL